MKYATHNADDVITGFYDEKIHGDVIPSGAVEITEDAWLLACSDGGADWLIDTETGDVSKVPKSAEQLAAEQLAANKAAQDAQKIAGIEFEGVMCSATAEDMWGLNSIESWIADGNDVNFKFSNGNMLLLNTANVASFKAVWIPFRASFF